jgi:hypothetical protein
MNGTFTGKAILVTGADIVIHHQKQSDIDVGYTQIDKEAELWTK